jgi:hypothetical protein
MMAGDVAVSVSNGDLRITGDAAANDVVVVQTTLDNVPVTGSYYVGGRPGTRINGQSGGATFTGVTRDININMGGGGDQVTMGPENEPYTVNNRLNVPRNLSIDMGSGGNRANLVGLAVANNASISAGTGADALVFHGNVQNDLTINTGGGLDLVNVYNSFIRRNMTIDALASNTSNVSVYLTQVNVGNDATITTGGGQDYINIDDTGINRNMTLRTGGNSDTVSFRDSEVASRLFADLGSGNDTLYLTNTYVGQAELDGGLGFLDKVFETNFSFGTRTIRGFETRK